LWSAFVVCIGGLGVRLLLLVRLSLRNDRPIYHYFSWKWLLLSLVHWLLPLNQTAKKHPVITAAGFVFHGSLIVTPIFLLAHGVLWYESWGVSWWFLPEKTADYLTLVTIGSGLFLFARRLLLAHVRLVSTTADYLVLALSLAPFVTGYLAYHQFFDYDTVLIVHMIAGELFLVAIPFTKLSHAVLFFASRAVTGMEFGRRRAPSW